MNKERVLVIGSGGMLGKLLVPRLIAAGYEVETRSGKEQLDISDPARTEAEIVGFKYIINCSAYTAVDKAESEPVAAIKANALGPKNLATALKESQGKLIHFSTDYVYGGTVQRRPLKETTAPSPVGVYGHSKFLGDEFINSILPERSAIFRTSWLHGETGPNFVSTILRVAAEKPEIRVVSDQIGSPTYAGWLADSVVKFLNVFEPGVYHAANQGEISWFDFAKKIVELGGLTCNVLPQTTEELSRPAPRPAYSALDCSKLEKLIGDSCQTWEEGLKHHLKRAGSSK